MLKLNCPGVISQSLILSVYNTYDCTVIFSKYCCSNHNTRNKKSSKVQGGNSKSKTYQNLENSQIMYIWYGENNTCEIKQIFPGDSGVPYHV